VSSVWLSKAGNQPDEYEDAFWPTRPNTRASRVIRYAVADGATEASFSGLWAAMLVRAFGRGQIPPSRLLDAIAPLQRTWRSEVARKPLPWYAEEKLRSGAFSSLLGLTLKQPHPDAETVWSAVAVGDSCLFVVRGSELITSFPMRTSTSFDNSPEPISSMAARNIALGAAICHDRGRARGGDRFYLTTDALACWFLARYEEGSEPWETLDHVLVDSPQDRFVTWMADERREHRIRNDDVTLLRICLE
jgi:hypothetical protein